MKEKHLSYALVSLALLVVVLHLGKIAQGEVSRHIPYSSAILEKNLLKAEEILNDVLVDMEGIDQCLLQKITSRNVHFVSATTWSPTSVSKTVVCRIFLSAEGERIFYDNQTLLPNHILTAPPLLALTLAHEYVHQCQFERERLSGEHDCTLYGPVNRDLERELSNEREAWLIELRLYKTLKERGIFIESDLYFKNPHRIKTLHFMEERQEKGELREGLQQLYRHTSL